jgi:hypothetical protein
VLAQKIIVITITIGTVILHHTLALIQAIAAPHLTITDIRHQYIVQLLLDITVIKLWQPFLKAET